ncbi:MAG TPA: IS4/IS5 family transposase, partial [Chloroflexota bacterium]
MVTIPQVQQALRATLGRAAPAAARPSGFTQRHSKLTAAAFVQTLVWGWLDAPAASLTTLSQTAAAMGGRISPQGLHQRFTRSAATLLRTVLAAAVEQALAAEPVAIPLLAGFTTVAVRDSTTITLPDALADEWRGCGGRVPTGGQAAVKLQMPLDLRRGRLDGPWLQAGRA